MTATPIKFVFSKYLNVWRPAGGEQRCSRSQLPHLLSQRALTEVKVEATGSRVGILRSRPVNPARVSDRDHQQQPVQEGNPRHCSWLGRARECAPGCAAYCGEAFSPKRHLPWACIMEPDGPASPQNASASILRRVSCDAGRCGGVKRKRGHACSPRRPQPLLQDSVQATMKLAQ